MGRYLLQLIDNGPRLPQGAIVIMITVRGLEEMNVDIDKACAWDTREEEVVAPLTGSPPTLNSVTHHQVEREREREITKERQHERDPAHGHGRSRSSAHDFAPARRHRQWVGGGSTSDAWPTGFLRTTCRRVSRTSPSQDGTRKDTTEQTSKIVRGILRSPCVHQKTHRASGDM